MTLPFERYNSIKNTEQFLCDLLDPKQTPRVPKGIRQRAYSCLKHYPQQYHLDVLATRSPEVMETPSPIDDLSMLVHHYEQRKNNGH